MEAPPRRRWIGLSVAIALTLAVLTAASRYRPDDAPYTPRDDAEVLERLVAGAAFEPGADTLRTLEAQLARAPSDLTLAAQVARRHIEDARRSGDARRLAYAEAALAPWWSAPAPPLVALLLRATIRQARHDFVAALADFDLAVRTAPDEPQAWLTRATVLGVLGRYDEARQSCAHLATRAAPIIEATCSVAVEGVTGGDAARGRLATLIDAPGIDVSERAWARSVLGESSLYAGDAARGERELRAALRDDPGDAYTRGLLADLLLDADRGAEVLTLVGATEDNEVLLLRRAIAARVAHAPDARALLDRLRAANDALRARGDTAHRREEARQLLSVTGDAAAALPIAAANFALQREPWDARVLLEAAAALASEAPARRSEAIAAAQPALEWLRRTGCAWPPLRRAAAALEATP